ncbi:hypothetical protein CAOG_06236 [Capsaspora owczarzaki ATCC 30864]|uniref:Inositol polyphosphate-related phosphatase domain-containing protein n=1 Tax=Capsaspora owczarzaki (strain ATCC 30864) TaxID=595528 RepID=A0A0D2X4C7_CAPO3|nr:hypothetical protein CAOG_06236 [Capsaspora owczarzaki ATCC 30864]KJE95829.1 hypothetical protein CAOG_006236 [Capsaspora owczarzaki ATCC 30864]KJE95830.1 hypothetical protein, variant [Capsaspora owczarzaki ATCC 30864]|eukprot:XP_004344985.1 hypothetical protein CAOG_06236 [Capsaspora owczarzaki ATCC 30864]
MRSRSGSYSAATTERNVEASQRASIANAYGRRPSTGSSDSSSSDDASGSSGSGSQTTSARTGSSMAHGDVAAPAPTAAVPRSTQPARRSEDNDDDATAALPTVALMNGGASGAHRRSAAAAAANGYYGRTSTSSDDEPPYLKQPFDNASLRRRMSTQQQQQSELSKSVPSVLSRDSSRISRSDLARIAPIPATKSHKFALNRKCCKCRMSIVTILAIILIVQQLLAIMAMWVLWQSQLSDTTKSLGTSSLTSFNSNVGNVVEILIVGAYQTLLAHYLMWTTGSYGKVNPPLGPVTFPCTGIVNWTLPALDAMFNTSVLNANFLIYSNLFPLIITASSPTVAATIALQTGSTFSAAIVAVNPDTRAPLFPQPFDPIPYNTSFAVTTAWTTACPDAACMMTENELPDFVNNRKLNCDGNQLYLQPNASSAAQDEPWYIDTYNANTLRIFFYREPDTYSIGRLRFTFPIPYVWDSPLSPPPNPPQVSGVMALDYSPSLVSSFLNQVKFYPSQVVWLIFDQACVEFGGQQYFLLYPTPQDCDGECSSQIASISAQMCQRILRHTPLNFVETGDPWTSVQSTGISIGSTILPVTVIITVSQSDVVGAVQESAIRAAYVSVGLLGLATAVVVFLAYKMATIIRRVISNLEDLAHGSSLLALSSDIDPLAEPINLKIPKTAFQPQKSGIAVTAANPPPETLLPSDAPGGVVALPVVPAETFDHGTSSMAPVEAGVVVIPMVPVATLANAPTVSADPNLVASGVAAVPASAPNAAALALPKKTRSRQAASEDDGPQLAEVDRLMAARNEIRMVLSYTAAQTFFAVSQLRDLDRRMQQVQAISIERARALDDFYGLVAPPSELTETSSPHECVAYLRRQEHIPLAVRSSLRALPTRPLSVFVGTWNVGNAKPPTRLTSWVQVGHDIVAIGVQECVYMKNSAAHFFSLVEQTLGRRYFRVAECNIVSGALQSVGEDKTHGPVEFLDLPGTGGLRLVVMALNEHREFITDVKIGREATGIARVMWNKGGVAISFSIYNSSMCFVASHLAAHQEKVKQRNRDVSSICRGLHLTDSSASLANAFDYLFWMGDLNYRIDLPRDRVLELTQKGDWDALFEHDQLHKECEAERVFSGFTEALIDFAPTFKLDRGQNVYESKLLRVPSWCDRILWKTRPGHHVSAVQYSSDTSIQTSDHRPVFGVYSVHAQLPFAPLITSLPCRIVLTDLRVTVSRAALAQNHEPTANPEGGMELDEIAPSLFFKPMLVVTGDMIEAEARSTSATAVDKKVPLQWTFSGSLSVAPILTDPAFLLRKHLLVIVSDDPDRRREHQHQGILSLKQAFDANPQPFTIPLRQFSTRTCELHGSIHVKFGPPEHFAHAHSAILNGGVTGDSDV